MQLTTLLPLLLTLTTAIPHNPKRASTEPGVDIANLGSKAQTFFFCNNARNDAAGADPGTTNGMNGCSNLVTSISVAPSATTAVALGTTFSGRIARSTLAPATWVEVRFMAAGQAWGDVSLEVGCDGAAEVGPTDGGSSVKTGWKGEGDIVAGAPEGATETRGDGVKVVSAPFSPPSTILNQKAADYLIEKVGNEAAYITTTDGTNVTVSANNRLAVWFY